MLVGIGLKLSLYFIAEVLSVILIYSMHPFITSLCQRESRLSIEQHDVAVTSNNLCFL